MRIYPTANGSFVERGLSGTGRIGTDTEMSQDGHHRSLTVTFHLAE
jgi:hypothetical protein